jgi:pantoate--beta-alanine ligase
MGALHAGHASLIKRSAEENDYTVVSIFVNPTQFGPGEDLDNYPRPLEADLQLCREAGATHAFTPFTHDIYPEGRETYQIQMSLRDMGNILCGATRPGHFNGVLQVVSKLFNIVRPHRAYFGEKDFQQLAVLRRLAYELFFPIEIRGCPIVRETDGLAMSSRNRYLNAEERKQALFLSHVLKKARTMAEPGMDTARIHEMVQKELHQYPLIRLDYFDIRSSDDLRNLDTLRSEDLPHGFVAAFCGKARLIDNLPVL